MILQNIKYISPVPDQRDFVWLAEYANGTHLCEFDVNSKTENSFYSIKKNELIKFGVFGYGYKFYYDIHNGKIHTPIGSYDFELDINEQVFNLTGRNEVYNDIITYKKAWSTIDLLKPNGTSSTNIVEYAFGFKKCIKLDDINLHFQILLKMPYQEEMCFNVKISSDTHINGIVNIKRDGIVIDRLPIEIESNTARMTEWAVT